MAAEASDSLPLKITPPSSPTDAEPKVKTPFVGLFLNKTKLIVIAVVVLVLILLVIILAALLGHANSKLKKSQDGVDDRKEGGKTTGSSPTKPVPTTPGTEAWWDVRLPKNIIPVHYDVLLDIDLEKYRFDGNVAIMANVTSSTNLVLVHSNKMNVTSAKVSTYAEGSAKKELSIVKHFWFKKNQFYVIQLEDNLEPGQIVIKMTFEAFLTDGLAGLYRSSYKHADGTNV